MISLNCGILGEDEMKVWRNREVNFRFEEVTAESRARRYNGFLKERIRVKIEQSDVKVQDLTVPPPVAPGEKPRSSSAASNKTNEPKELPTAAAESPDVAEKEAAPADPTRESEYQLTSILCQIETGKEPNHLVAFIRIPGKPATDTTAAEDARWFLFNDFLVKEVTLAEALQFKARWKIPAILQFTRTDIGQTIAVDELKQEFDRQVITEVDDRYACVMMSSKHHTKLYYSI